MILVKAICKTLVSTQNFHSQCYLTKQNKSTKRNINCSNCVLNVSRDILDLITVVYVTP